MTVKIEIKGLRELDRALGQLEGKGVATKRIRSAMREAAKPLINQIESNAPRPDPNDRNSYSLADNIKMQLERLRRRKTPAQFRIGPARRTREDGDHPDYPIVGGLSKNKAAPNYARIIESKTGFIIKAFDSHGASVVSGFAAIMKKHIDREARAIAARKKI